LQFPHDDFHALLRIDCALLGSGPVLVFSRRRASTMLALAARISDRRGSSVMPLPPSAVGSALQGQDADKFLGKGLQLAEALNSYRPAAATNRYLGFTTVGCFCSLRLP
jgi:hypothetical protein